MTRAQHRWFAGLFLAIIYSAPLVENVVQAVRGRVPQFLDIFIHAPTRPNLRAYEKRMEDESVIAQSVRPWIQYFQFLLFREPGDKVLLGRDGWLFYKPDMQYLVEPASDDAFQAIVDFRDQLARRGVHLLVLPMPGKPALYGRMLTPRANRAIDSPTGN